MGGQGGERNDDGEESKGQATVPDESHVDLYVHGFWKWGTSALFDMQLVNLDAGSYLHQTSTKDLAMAEKEKKDKNLQPCLKRRCYFSPTVYCVDGIP